MSDDELAKLRQQIDDLDDQLLKLLAERMAVARQIGTYKKTEGLPLSDEGRMEAVLRSQLAKAGAADLSEAYIRQLYEVIYKYTLEAEADVS